MSRTSAGLAALHEVGDDPAQERHRPSRQGAAPLPPTRASSTRSGTATSYGERCRSSTSHAFWPPKRPGRSAFLGAAERRSSTARSSRPGSGYVNDPQLATHNLQRAAEAHGADASSSAARSIEIRRDADGVRGVTLADGASIDAPVVVNVAGPHSVRDQPDGRRRGRMNVKTRALRHEVHHVPAPPDFDFEADGYHTSDGDMGIYFRPETGNHILIGSEDPDAIRVSGSTIPTTTTGTVTEANGKRRFTGCARRIPTLADSARAQGRRRSLRRLRRLDPDLRPLATCRASTWRSARAATSSRTRPSSATDGRADRRGSSTGTITTPSRSGSRPRYTGLELDAGFYSRLREINPDSSFSVNG